MILVLLFPASAFGPGPGHRPGPKPLTKNQPTPNSLP